MPLKTPQRYTYANKFKSYRLPYYKTDLAIHSTMSLDENQQIYTPVQVHQPDRRHAEKSQLPGCTRKQGRLLNQL